MKSHDAGASDHRETKPFLAHLEDLRSTILKCLLALGLGFGLALPFTPEILAFLKKPLLGLVENPDTFLRSLEVSGAFNMAMRVSLWSGLLISAPFLVCFIAAFIFPGLTRREQSLMLKSSGFAVALFALGVYLGYAVTLRVALAIMLGMHRWLGIQPEWTIASYVTFSIQLLLAFGLTFELPLVVVILGRLGIITSRQLREKRRHAIVVILIIAMIMTPPDVFSQVIMGIPLILLYEVCIWIIHVMEKKAVTGNP